MTRPRAKPIKVWVTEDERALIGSLAASANLSLSAYLRAAGLNKPIRSVMDIHAVQELSKVNGDLGRMAELLELWLTEKRGFFAHPREVERMMKEFRNLQKQSHEIMGRMLR
jgi:hypothetical protein